MGKRKCRDSEFYVNPLPGMPRCVLVTLSGMYRIS